MEFVAEQTKQMTNPRRPATLFRDFSAPMVASAGDRDFTGKEDRKRP